MSTFKKLFATLVLVLFVTSVSFAQVNKNYDGVKPELRKGAHSLVFMYSPFVSGSLGAVFAGTNSVFTDTTSLGTGTLYGAGYRYYFSPQFSLMGGVSFGMDKTSFTFNGGSGETSTTTYGISLDGMYQFKPLYSIAPYIGLNANFGMYESEVTSTLVTTTTVSTNKGSAFGGGLGVGFDWYFTEGMSLGGKYTVGVRSYSAPEYTVTGGPTSISWTGADRTIIGFGIASIYLNVHLP
ncbi:MAG: outer membrane beta-barrel protein [Ignavibacteria bacterium]|nr:outer membrane beta-barrel protein [Ignavibacteria bacterium]